MIPIPQVNDRPTPRGQLSAPGVTPMQDATGVQVQQIGRGLQQAGHDTFALATDLQEELDAAEVRRADNLLADAVRMEMQDPQKGYLNTTGKAAIGDPRKEAVDRLEQRAAKITETLSTSRQREMFQQQMDRRMLAARTAAGNHEAEQVRVFSMGEAEARVKSLMTDSAQAILDHDITSFARDRAAMLQEIDNYAELQGLPADSVQRKNMRLGATTQLHATVFDTMIQGGKVREATEYLKTFGREMSPDARSGADRVLVRAQLNEDAQRLAYSLTADAQTPEMALAEVKRKFDAGEIPVQLHDEAIQRIDQHFDRQAKREAAISDRLLSAAESFFSKPENQTKVYADLGPQVTAEMERRGIDGKLRDYLNSGRQRVTQPGATSLLESMPDATLRMLSLPQFRQLFYFSLSKPDWEYAEARFNKAHEKEVNTALLSEREMMRFAAARIFGIPASGELKPAQEKQYVRFVQLLQPRVDAYAKTVLKGERRPNPDELSKLADGLEKDTVTMRKGITGMFDWLIGAGVTETVPVASLSLEAAREARIDVGGKTVFPFRIPDDYRDAIVEGLMQAGLPVTQQAIAESWVNDFHEGK